MNYNQGPYRPCYFCEKIKIKLYIVKKDYLAKVPWTNRLMKVKKGEYRSVSMNRHHVDENRKNNIMENLVDLCPSCHKRLHVLYNKWKKVYINNLNAVQRAKSLEK